jgi:L-asparagine transporter-like permease
MLHIASYCCYLFLLKFTYIILSRLFQHVMSLTYEHVLFNWALRSCADIVQKIINKGATRCKM